MYEILGSTPTPQEEKNKTAYKKQWMVVASMPVPHNLIWKGLEDIKPKANQDFVSFRPSWDREVQEQEETGNWFYNHVKYQGNYVYWSLRPAYQTKTGGISYART